MQITRQDLEKIYYENTNQQAAKILKISMTTLTKYIKQNDIKLKGSGRIKKQNKIRIIG